MHGSPVPAYGGFDPLNWAVVNGEKEVGVPAHMVDADLDAGDVVLQRAVPVEPRDTATDLSHQSLVLFGPLTFDALELVASGRTEWSRQDRSQPSFFHKLSVEDSPIDWTWPAEDIANLVRAQSDPYPSAFTFHQGQRIRVLAASPSEGRCGGTPGRIVIRDGGGVVVVAGADARRGRSRGLVVERVRTDDGEELAATEHFRTMGGYPTRHR